PLYFEFMVWPMMSLFTAVAIFAICWHIVLAVRRRSTWSETRSDLAITYCLLAAVLIVIATWNTAAALSQRPTVCGEFFPIQSSLITDHLRNNVALQPRAAFRGLVATFAGAQGKLSVNWMDLHGYDATLWKTAGNDHRTVGLWWYRIPTLFQYSALITPPYYLLLTDFLSRPSDKQVRNV